MNTLIGLAVSLLEELHHSQYATRGTSLTLHAAQAKTFLSLKGRMNLKIAVFNLLHHGGAIRVANGAIRNDNQHADLRRGDFDPEGGEALANPVPEGNTRCALTPLWTRTIRQPGTT